MNRSHTTLGLLAVAALAIPTAARAEAFSTGHECGGPTLTTCAAVQVSRADPGLSFRISNLSFNQMNLATNYVLQIHTIRVAEMSDPTPGSGGQFTQSCPGHPMDPTDCPPTITPEPVSMTLLATGLIGMTGFGAAARRRRNQNRPS